jgi:Tol biopolymer transport system component
MRRTCIWAALEGLAVLVLALPPAQAAFPGQNGRIAFTRDQHIWTMAPGGSDQTQLTSSERDWYPTWSPDGTTIAFERAFDTPTPFPPSQSDIFTMQSDGTQQRNLTDNTLNEFIPTWSPDGTRIAFDGQIGGCLGGDCDSEFEDLFVMNSDGTGRTRLTNRNGFDELYPEWSPDGSKLVFADDGHLYTLMADGTGVTELTAGRDTMPSWSPDGAKIAFASRRDETNTNCGLACNYNIYVADADGTGAVRLTDTPAIESWPAWSPDGTQIAFVRYFCGASTCSPSDIYVIDADGSGERRLTDSPGSESTPDWQPLPNSPPDCSRVSASPSVLHPPNHRLTPVALAGATDIDGDAVTLTVTGVTQDEPTGGAPDAAPGSAPNRVQLRAERDGNGRVYRVAFEASDGRGGTCAGTAEVGVTKGSHAAVDSAPPSYDSFGS